MESITRNQWRDVIKTKAVVSDSRKVKVFTEKFIAQKTSIYIYICVCTLRKRGSVRALFPLSIHVAARIVRRDRIWNIHWKYYVVERISYRIRTPVRILFCCDIHTRLGAWLKKIITRWTARSFRIYEYYHYVDYCFVALMPNLG